jgi:hypothetical protein
MAMNTFEWENGSLVEPAKVEIGGVSYDVTDAQYEGNTPLSASNLNLMQSTLLGNVKDDLTDDTKIPSVKAIKSTYSTTEKVVGTWIDGKPIYRKVVYYGNLPNATAKSVAHNISNLKQVITIDGVCFDGNDAYYTLPLVYRGSDSSYNVQTNVNSTDIRMASSQDRSSFTAYIIIEYTKTTD